MTSTRVTVSTDLKSISHLQCQHIYKLFLCSCSIFISQLIFVMIKVSKTAVGSDPIGISTTCRNILLPHLPTMDLKHFISKLSSFLSAMVVTVHVSDAYVAVGSIRARYSLTLTLIVIFVFEKIILLSFSNALLASPILQSTSNPLPGIKLPRKINLYVFNRFTTQANILILASHYFAFISIYFHPFICHMLDVVHWLWVVTFQISGILE